jgi:hypothetical protein
MGATRIRSGLPLREIAAELPDPSWAWLSDAVTAYLGLAGSSE